MIPNSNAAPGMEGADAGSAERRQAHADDRAVREVHARWIDAVNGGDLAGLLGLMTQDAVFLNPGREPVGRDAFPEGFSGAHERAGIHCVSELQDVVVAADVAYTLSRDSLRMAPHAGGSALELAGDRLTVYRRQPDGRWLLARDAHTLTPVAS